MNEVNLFLTWKWQKFYRPKRFVVLNTKSDRCNIDNSIYYKCVEVLRYLLFWHPVYQKRDLNWSYLGSIYRLNVNELIKQISYALKCI